MGIGKCVGKGVFTRIGNTLQFDLDEVGTFFHSPLKDRPSVNDVNTLLLLSKGKCTHKFMHIYWGK